MAFVVARFPIVKNDSATTQPVSGLDLAQAYYTALQNFDRIEKREHIVSGQREMTLKEQFGSICALAAKNRYLLIFRFQLPNSVLNSPVSDH